jgi:hypothetical protein
MRLAAGVSWSCWGHVHPERAFHQNRLKLIDAMPVPFLCNLLNGSYSKAKKRFDQDKVRAIRPDCKMPRASH